MFTLVHNNRVIQFDLLDQEAADNTNATIHVQNSHIVEMYAIEINPDNPDNIGGLFLTAAEFVAFLYWVENY